MLDLLREVPVMGAVRHVHFVGIGGAGMCGIAEILLAQGYRVSGSDSAATAVTARLAKLGATVTQGHRAAAVEGANAVVTTSALAADNVEVAAARRHGIAVVERGVMLAELMRYRQGIAVAGSHGKTTTASMIASIFEAAGLEPSFAIGGTVTADGGNARWRQGPHFIAEADESDASFLHLRPVHGVVTGIDDDHLDTYDQDAERLRQAFADFVRQLPFYGTAVVNVDDQRAATLPAAFEGATLTYGFSAQADCRAVQVRGAAPEQSLFRAERPNAADLAIALSAAGCHNVQNALAAIAVATVENVADDAIVQGLANYRGVARRFQIDDCVARGKRFVLVDDYGHHPTELRQVIAAMRRLWPRRRLLMAYQPHRYSRTRDLFEDFVAALSQVDVLVLCDVYAASEPFIDGADGRSLAAAIRRHGEIEPIFAADPAAALDCLLDAVANDDVVAVQGAGDIDAVAEALRSER